MKKIGSGRISNENDEMDILKKEIEDLKINVAKLEEEREAEAKKSLQYQSEKIACDSENISYREEILKLKQKQSELTSESSDLEDCKTTDADLVISNKELKECNEELESELQKNNNLQTRNANCLKSLEESKSLAATNRRLLRQCQEKYEDEVDKNEALQNELQSICPIWSEWSDCSQTCRGVNAVKTRTDKCSVNDKENEPCNQEISCPKTGNFEDSCSSKVNFILSVGYAKWYFSKTHSPRLPRYESLD